MIPNSVATARTRTFGSPNCLSKNIRSLFLELEFVHAFPMMRELNLPLHPNLKTRFLTRLMKSNLIGVTRYHILLYTRGSKTTIFLSI